MLDRIFIPRDLRASLRKTLLWSLIIAFLAVIVTQMMYGYYFPEIYAKYGHRLLVYGFFVTLLIAMPFITLFFSMTMRLSTMNSQLQEIARRDGLTGLLNRTALENLVRDRSEAPREEGAHDDALILIDIDHFKAINDTHGHAAGDHVLRMVAVSIVGNVFERDHVARIGGEEFAVYLLGAGPTGAVEAAERIRAALEENKTYFEGKVIRVTASIGGALYPQEADFGAIFQGADFALYRAKRSGRNQCEFNGLPAIWHTREEKSGLDDSDAA